MDASGGLRGGGSAGPLRLPRRSGRAHLFPPPSLSRIGSPRRSVRVRPEAVGSASPRFASPPSAAGRGQPGASQPLPPLPNGGRRRGGARSIDSSALGGQAEGRGGGGRWEKKERQAKGKEPSADGSMGGG